MSNTRNILNIRSLIENPELLITEYFKISLGEINYIGNNQTIPFIIVLIRP